MSTRPFGTHEPPAVFPDGSPAPSLAAVLNAMADAEEAFARRHYFEGNPSLEVTKRRVVAMRAGAEALEDRLLAFGLTR